MGQVHHQIDQNVKCIITMRIEAISFQIFRFRYINILREIIKNNFPFSPEFGHHFLFYLSASQDALLAKSLTLPKGGNSAVRRARGEKFVSDNSKCIRPLKGLGG
jgi:hypothetical protein